MPSQSFVFKKFTVLQDKCAHKVGTDAVLIGAWVQVSKARTILDIGTGTGIIALMMAQNSIARIDALDIEHSSFSQANENVKNSPWSERINVHHTSLQDYIKDCKKKYDVIVTNPPYFVDSFKAPDEERSHARHNDMLPFTDIIEGVKKIMEKEGKFYIILPTKEALHFKTLAKKKGLHLLKLVRVKTKSINETEKRHIMKFSFNKGKTEEEIISIEKEGRHDYTEEYKALTNDFYLHF